MKYVINIIFTPPLPCGLCTIEEPLPAQGGALIDNASGPGPYFILPVCRSCISRLQSWSMPAISFPLSIDETSRHHIQTNIPLGCHGVDFQGCTGELKNFPIVQNLEVFRVEQVWVAIAFCPQCQAQVTQTPQLSLYYLGASIIS